MSTKMEKHECYDEYTFFDMAKDNDTYETGDDHKCPVCGAEIDGFNDLNYMNGVVQGVCYCHECNHTLSFNYYLQNVIAE